MMPKQRDMEIHLPKCLDEMGGRARPSEIYTRIPRFFPDLTNSDLTETLTTGGNKWTNRIQWVRQRLVSIGEMASPEHGVWAITDKGMRRLAEVTDSGTSRESELPKDSQEVSYRGSVNLNPA